MGEGGTGFTIWGDLAIDLSQVAELPEAVQRALMASSSKDANLRLVVDDGQAKAQVASLNKDMNTLGHTTARPQVDVRATVAQGQVKALSADMNQLSRTVAKPRVDLDGFEDTRAKFASMHTQLDALDRQTTALGTGGGTATGGLGALSTSFSAGRGGGVSGLMGATAGAGAAGVAGFAAGLAVSLTAQMTRPILTATAGRAESGRQLTETTSRVYGVAGGDAFNQAAKALEEQTGFLAEDFQRAALLGSSLVNNYGLQQEALRKLLPIAADFASVSPDPNLQTVQATMDRVTAAIRGETRGAEDLGLTLNDTYMKTMAANGAYKDTWATMGETAQAQARYNEILKQAGNVMGAAKDDESLTGQVRMFNAEVTSLGRSIGRELLPSLAGFVGLVKDLVDAIPSWIPKAIGYTAKAVSYLTKEGQFSAPGAIPGIGPVLQVAEIVRKNQQFIDAATIPGRVRVAGADVMAGAQSVLGNITITLNDQTGGGIHVQRVDAGSFAPSPY